MTQTPEPPPAPRTSVRTVLQAALRQLQRRPSEAIEAFLGETIWRWNLKRMPLHLRLGALLLRIIYLAGRAFVSQRAQLQAMALTYTTMLALVPAFAITLAVFSLGGLEDVRVRFESFVFQQIAASPDQELKISGAIQDLATNISSNRAGASLAFLAFLFLTVVALLNTLEKTLYQVWGVQRSRSFISKFITYWAIATLGPLIMGFALVQGSAVSERIASRGWPWSEPPTAAAAVTPPPAEEAFGFGGAGGALVAQYEAQRRQQQELTLGYFITGINRPMDQPRGSMLLTWMLTVVMFTLIYAFLPNTKVELLPALTGAVVAASLWLLTKWGLTLSSATLVKYNTLYGSLATIPITMFWLYVTWLVVILGAELTFAIQNSGDQRKEELAAETSTLCKEIVALRLVALVAHAFDRGAPPPTRPGLAEQIGAPVALCGALLFHLCEDGILREIDTRDEHHGFAPGRPLEAITLSDVIDSLREKAGISFDLAWGEDLPVLSEQLGRGNTAFRNAAGKTTLREVVQQLERRIKSGHALTPELAAVSVITARAIATAGEGPGRDLRAPDESSVSDRLRAASGLPQPGNGNGGEAASPAAPATEGAPRDPT